MWDKEEGWKKFSKKGKNGNISWKTGKIREKVGKILFDIEVKSGESTIGMGKLLSKWEVESN